VCSVMVSANFFINITKFCIFVNVVLAALSYVLEFERYSFVRVKSLNEGSLLYVSTETNGS